jgi:hypothetical protein
MPMADVYKDAIPLSMASKYPTIPMGNAETAEYEIVGQMNEESKL